MYSIYSIYVQYKSCNNLVTLELATNLQQSSGDVVKTYITVSLQSLGMKIQRFLRVSMVQNYSLNNHCTATCLPVPDM